jgi:hypothetical protein
MWVGCRTAMKACRAQRRGCAHPTLQRPAVHAKHTNVHTLRGGMTTTTERQKLNAPCKQKHDACQTRRRRQPPNDVRLLGYSRPGAKGTRMRWWEIMLSGSIARAVATHMQ